MPRSVNQKRLQTSQGRGKIVCKHDLILIQSRLNEDKQVMSVQQTERTARRVTRQAAIGSKRNGRCRLSGAGIPRFQDDIYGSGTRIVSARKIVSNDSLLKAAKITVSHSEICARARF
uniref:hypothetical protein n=1 Tax=Candidatus Pantoea varia TaxID=1881036 RepID=UPI0011135D11|nr:hypothetical protein [Pantoea varia]